MKNAPSHHDERYEKLESLSDWELENDDQDIRGRPLVDAQGKRLGVIDDLLVDKGGERVAAVRLDDGATCGVENLDIQPDQVTYRARTGATAVPPPDNSNKPPVKDGGQRVELVEEKIAIGKRDVDGGTIRVRTRLVTDKVEKDVKLHDEMVDVDRRPVDRELLPEEADKLFQERTISATEHHEEAIVAKTARVKEEVILKKDVGEHVEHVEETVRHTEVEVDRNKAGLAGQGKENDPTTGKPRR